MIGGPDEEPSGRDEPLAAGSEAETLSYLSALIEQLMHLADRAGYRTMAAVLSAALTEARIQRDQRRR